MKFFAAILMALGMMGGANAALYSRAGGTMVYDDVLNITWLADWLTGPEMLGVPNTTWGSADLWADALVYGGFSDWRLPRGPLLLGRGYEICFECNSNEMGYMFFVNWGATSGNSYSSGTNTANLALFAGIRPSRYWTSTLTSGTGVWALSMTDGQWIAADFNAPFGFVAVRDGDVADVPVPTTLALLGLGLAGIGAARRRL